MSTSETIGAPSVLPRGVGRPRKDDADAARKVLTLRLTPDDERALAALLRDREARLRAVGLVAEVTATAVVRDLLQRAAAALAAPAPAPPPADPAAPLASPPATAAPARPAKPRPAPKASGPAAGAGDGPTDEELRAGVRKAGEDGTSARALWSAARWNPSSGSRWMNGRTFPRGKGPQPMPDEVRAALATELRRLGALR